MSGASHLKLKSIFGIKPRAYASNFFVASSLAVGSMLHLVLPCCAQLPATNMGQFVHQPGDNQYTAQTQSDRHPAPMPVMPMAPVSSNSSSNEYRPTPAAAKPDISLLPIVADEPIKPAGFPPLPDRLDLPTGATAWAPGVQQRQANYGNYEGPGASAGVSSAPTGVHQHYVHYQPGAFMPPGAMPQNNYRPSSADYYNVNPNARAAAVNMSAPAQPVETPSAQALKSLGAEPRLAADEATRPEAPTAVTVNQSVSQDLSLPEDDFNKHYPANIGNSANGRAGRGLGRAIGYPVSRLLYTGAGMATYGAMYALRR